MNQFYSLLLSCFLFSCATRFSYMGTSSTPTTHVDVFVDASAIRQPYTIIGKGYQESVSVNKEILQEKAIMKAKEKGADAVLFQDYFLTGNETSAYSISKSDSSGKTLTVNRKNASSAVVNSEITILFLKYN